MDKVMKLFVKDINEKVYERYMRRRRSRGATSAPQPPVVPPLDPSSEPNP